MSRGFVSVTNTGLKDITQYLDKIESQYDEITYQSVQSMQDAVVDRIKSNVISMIGGDTGRYIFDSVGKSTAKSKSQAHVIVGTMGVYKMDTVDAAHGKTSKDLNAAQLAYWIEYGTSRLKSGGRKKNGETYKDEDLVTVTAKPFLGNAFYGSIDEQNESFRIKFNELVDKIK